MTLTPANSASSGSDVVLPPEKSKDTKRKITRNRISLSCAACRQRKVKCDRQHPICSTCRQNDDTCIYDGDPKASKTRSAAGHGQTRKRRRLVEDGVDLSHSPATGLATENLSLQVLEGQLSLLKSLVESFRGARPEQASQNHIGTMLTPVASDSAGRSELNGEDIGSATGDDATSSQTALTDLTEPLENLDLEQKYEAMTHSRQSSKVLIWNYIQDEVTHLQSVVQRHNVRCCATPESQSEDGSDDDDFTAVKHSIQGGTYPLCASLSFHELAAIHGGVSDKVENALEKRMFEKSALIEGIQVWDLELGAQWNTMFYTPTENQSRVLYRSWMTNVHPVLPIICPLRIWEIHEAFWTMTKTGKSIWESPPVLESLPLLYAIWYSGARSVSQHSLQLWFSDTTRPTLCANFHDETVHWLKRNRWPVHTTTAGLIAFIMIQSMPIMEEEPAQTAAYVSLIVRAAQNLSLHRVTKDWPCRPMEFEYYKRMWWHVVYMDISQAIAGHHPPIIADHTFETPMPDEVNDAALFTAMNQTSSKPMNAALRRESNSESDAQRDPPEPTTHSMIVKARAIISKTLRYIAGLHFKLDQVSNAEWESAVRVMDQTEAAIKDIVNRIPTKGLPELGFTPDSSEKVVVIKELEDDPLAIYPVTQAEIAFAKGSVENCGRPLAWMHRRKQVALNKWARMYLSALSDQIQCIAVAPVLRNAKSKVWDFARQCSLRWPMSYMRKFLELATDPSIEALRWTWPGDFQPLHAVSILLVDLYARPRSIEASRARAFIDTAFSLTNTDNGSIIGLYGKTAQRPFHEEGSDLWELTRQLRDKAWRKAGLDPDYLWTEESQIVLGIANPLTGDQLMSQSLREDTFGTVEMKNPTVDNLQKAIRQVRAEANAAVSTQEKNQGGSVEIDKVVNPAADSHGAQDDMAPAAVAERLGLELMPFPVKHQIKPDRPSNYFQNYSRPTLSFIPDSQKVLDPGFTLPVKESDQMQARLSLQNRKGYNREFGQSNESMSEEDARGATRSHQNIPKTLHPVPPAGVLHKNSLGGHARANLDMAAPDQNSQQLLETAFGNRPQSGADIDNPQVQLASTDQGGVKFGQLLESSGSHRYGVAYQGQSTNTHTMTNTSDPNLSSTHPTLEFNPQISSGNTVPNMSMNMEWSAQGHNHNQNHIHETINDQRGIHDRMPNQDTPNITGSNIAGDQMEMDFDWDRWDAMFGLNSQYCGLMDVMNGNMQWDGHGW